MKTLETDLVGLDEEEVCESYEAAMHYECRMCKKKCYFRKGTSPTSELIAVACFILLTGLTVVYGVIYGVKVTYEYLRSLL